MRALVDLDLRRTCMGQRYGRDPISLHVCGDCGAYVADQVVHNAWHNGQSSVFQAAGSPPPAFELGIPAETREFSRLLFSVAQEHLDPRHERLQWSVGFTGGGGPGPVKEWGNKFGWAAPQDTGQAMIYVAVGNVPMADRLPCGQYDYPGPSNCRSEIMPDQSEAQVLTNPDRLEVHWSRPDGSYVFVIADSTFRNNSLTPSQAALPTLGQLKAFVMDPRLVLP
jgi:hypothetical protein